MHTNHLENTISWAGVQQTRDHYRGPWRTEGRRLQVRKRSHAAISVSEVLRGEKRMVVVVGVPFQLNLLFIDQSTDR